MIREISLEEYLEEFRKKIKVYGDCVSNRLYLKSQSIMDDRSIYRNFFKTAFKKFLRPSLEAINIFLADSTYKIWLSYVDIDSHEERQYEADIKVFQMPNKKGIHFEINIEEQLKNGGVKYLNSYGLDRALSISQDGLTLKTSPMAIKQFECNFPKVPRILSGVLTNIRSDNKQYDNSYFRYCLQVEDGQLIYPASIIEAKDHLKFDMEHLDLQPSLIGIPFPSIKGMYIALEIQGKSFHLYAVESFKSVFIDSLQKMDLEEFKIIGSHIRLAFAFLSGRYYGGESLILISKDKNFKKISDIDYSLDTEGIKGKQQLINPTELFKFYQNMASSETFQKKFENAHERFNSEIFSRFCSLLFENQTLSRAVEILVNSSASTSPLQQGILCSVALETITELIAIENSESIKPIPSKATARTLIKNLKKILQDHSADLPKEALPVIESKLNDLNKPTNKNKLLFPFQKYGLPLSETDENILGHRNDFLHGRSPVSQTETWRLEMIALKLHYLAGILILKYIGYSGHVMNLPMWVLFNDNEKMKEYFPMENPQKIKEIMGKLAKDFELTDEALGALESTGRLSAFMEDIIRLI